MALLETLSASFGGVWDFLTGLIILLSLIVFLVVFFTAQYYLIKGYFWLFSRVYNIPFVFHGIWSIIEKLTSIKRPERRIVRNV